MGYEKSALIRDAGSLWTKATTARFLTAIGAGDLPDDALDRWLVQDRIFASDLYRFQAVVLAKAPESARPPIHAGLNAIEAELEWFSGLWEERSLEAAPPHPVCSRYTDYLVRAAHTEPFSRLIQILFGVEVSYLHAWSGLAKAGPLPEGIHGVLIERWSSEGFREYVEALLALAEAHPHPDDDAFRRVLDLEREFWRMTWEG